MFCCEGLYKAYMIRIYVYGGRGAKVDKDGRKGRDDNACSYARK